MHKVFLALIIDLLYIGLAEPTACVLNHFPKTNDPLYLIESQPNIYTFLVPKPGDEVVTVNQGEYIHLVCIGKGNYLVQGRAPVTVATCSGENELNINGFPHHLSSVRCKEHSSASVIDTKKVCDGRSGTMFEIGFELPNPYGWKKMIDICYDTRNGITYYTKHHLYSSTEAARVHKPSRTKFIQGPSLFPLEVYTKDHQRQIFHALFGDKASEYYNQRSSYLAKGHLAPDADFIYSAWQLSTYYLINVAPQWQQINGGQWFHTAELGIRDYALRQKTDLEIITGTTGVLKLDDQHSTPREIFLVPDSLLPVPEYYWKIVINLKAQTCMGVIGTNNPYLKGLPQLGVPNLCPQWTTAGSKRTGLIFCVSYHDMQMHIPEVPPGMPCSNGILPNFS